ncbi:hypothetical protein LINPERHAP2_LOCUS24466 [Linum perenne]
MHIEKANERSRFRIARQTLNKLYEVMERNNGFMVDLHLMSFRCGYWELSGILCHHVVSAIVYLRLEVDVFVHKYYYIDYVARGYTDNIPTVGRTTSTGASEWIYNSSPMMKCMPGRPKEVRRKEASELHPSTSQRRGQTKLREHGMVMHYCKCKAPGHNRRSRTFEGEQPATEGIDVADQLHP